MREKLHEPVIFIITFLKPRKINLEPRRNTVFLEDVYVNRQWQWQYQLQWCVVVPGNSGGRVEVVALAVAVVVVVVV